MSDWGWIGVFTVVAGVGMLPLIINRSSAGKTVESVVATFVLAFLAALLVIALPQTIA